MSDLSNAVQSWAMELTDIVEDWQFDYTGVLIHEIGHVLGFVNANDSVNADNHTDYQTIAEYGTSLNLFTRSHENVGQDTSDINYGDDIFFSIDEGQTNLGYLSTGVDTNLNGDGRQASHWKYDIDAMMNPALAPGQRRTLTDTDLRVFDVTGWDVDYNQDFDTNYVVSHYEDEAINAITDDNNYAIENMLNQYRWGRGSSGNTRFRQDQYLVDYLAQEGLFQDGVLWSHTPTETTSVPEPASTAGFFGLSLLGFLAGKRRSGKS